MGNVSFSVTDVVLDSEWCQNFYLTRVYRNSNSMGFGAVTGRLTLNCLGVITNAKEKDLDRLPRADSSTEAIKVVSPIQMAVATSETAPDTIWWNGSSYMVEGVKNYSDYGQGYYNAIATFMEFSALPPEVGSFVYAGGDSVQYMGNTLVSP